jgi:opacity protein-like surface antigen
MKIRVLLLISTFLLIIPAIKAQDVKDNLRIGISASLGKNLSSEKMSFSDYTGFSADYSKPNYRFGLNLEYLLKTSLTINGAVHYSNRAFTGTYFCDVCNFAVPPSPENVDFSFIDVPITIKYYFLPQKIRLFGEVGINNSFPLNNLGYEERVNSYVIGFKLGGGLEYNISEKIALQLAVDYNNSTSKIFKDSHFEDAYFKLKSINFGITVLKKI